MTGFYTIKWLEDGRVSMLDQRLLPQRVEYNAYSDLQSVARAIKEMVIRGAPAIGAAAAYGLALVPWHASTDDLEKVLNDIQEGVNILRKARPTAVNLFWAVNRMLDVLEREDFQSVEELKTSFYNEARKIELEDVEINQAIARNAYPLIPDQADIIHHCNTGSLAAVDYGTALGVIRWAHEQGKEVFTYVDETRPRLQGSRLTAWELQQYGVPFKVIVDSASGHFLRSGAVDLCIVGTDRVAANGDVANKIGTYNLAVVAKENEIPFYVAVPKSTIDLNTESGDEIEIEERDSREVTHIGENQITPDGTDVGNPAFDITPAEYVTAFITEQGIVRPPYPENLAGLFSKE